MSSVGPEQAPAVVALVQWMVFPFIQEDQVLQSFLELIGLESRDDGWSLT
jgi:hypothetical protein